MHLKANCDNSNDRKFKPKISHLFTNMFLIHSFESKNTTLISMHRQWLGNQINRLTMKSGGLAFWSSRVECIFICLRRWRGVSRAHFKTTSCLLFIIFVTLEKCLLDPHTWAPTTMSLFFLSTRVVLFVAHLVEWKRRSCEHTKSFVTIHLRTRWHSGPRTQATYKRYGFAAAATQLSLFPMSSGKVLSSQVTDNASSAGIGSCHRICVGFVNGIFCLILDERCEFPIPNSETYFLVCDASIGYLKHFIMCSAFNYRYPFDTYIKYLRCIHFSLYQFHRQNQVQFTRSIASSPLRWIVKLNGTQRWGFAGYCAFRPDCNLINWSPLKYTFDDMILSDLRNA